MKPLLLLSFLVTVACMAARKPAAAAEVPPAPPPPDTLRLKVLPLPAASRASFSDFKARPGVLSSPDAHVWCPSLLRADDGKYHFFHSQWPRAKGYSGWLTQSQVVHEVADAPEGPYRPHDIALNGRGTSGWNAVNAHNPKIARFGGTYFLYFIATCGERDEGVLADMARRGGAHPLWMKLRNNQRTGVAVADSPDGPWRVSEKPIVEPAGPIAHLTVNPAVCQGPDGTFFMIVKGDKPSAPGKPENHSVRNQALATAPAPQGPFTVQPQPVIDSFDTEDASMWYDQERRRFYAVVHVGGAFIGMMTSADGRHWEQAAQFKLAPRRIAFDDGSSWEPDSIERPFVLTDEQGQPQKLLVAVRQGKGNALRSWILVLPLGMEEPQGK